MGEKCDCGANQSRAAIGGITKLCAYKVYTMELFLTTTNAWLTVVNSQPLTNPLVCLGDGHHGVWNIVQEIATLKTRCEILDWYHLKENLYKVGGSLQRLHKAEALLWQGQVDAATTLFTDCRNKQAKNFCAYLNQHRHRIVNYSYYQAEQLCSIGSGAVESAIKQIGFRIKISGAQWKTENVNQILSVRCAYLNGTLAIWYSRQNGMPPH